VASSILSNAHTAAAPSWTAASLKALGGIDYAQLPSRSPFKLNCDRRSPLEDSPDIVGTAQSLINREWNSRQIAALPRTDLRRCVKQQTV
jgi:hypothetical protein